MAETDILNPQTGYWAQINDNPNPSYGFTRKVNANSQLARARMGSWYQRENSNDGYAFALSYINRPWTTMLRLKQFYEIGKSGYFTFIDYDGGGRHHVGRFTTQPNPTQIANGKYNVLNLIFEEIPQARMVNYPSDFVNWSRTINVVDDFLNPTVATQGNWTSLSNSTVTVEGVPGLPIVAPPPGVQPPTPSLYTLFDTAPAAGDFAQVRYVGFGFQMNFPLNAAYGDVTVLLDGQPIVSGLNLTNGTYTALGGYTPVNSPMALALPVVTVNIVSEVASTVTVQLAQVPLDIHRVKVIPILGVSFEIPNATVGFVPALAPGGSTPQSTGFVNVSARPVCFPAVTVIV